MSLLRLDAVVRGSGGCSSPAAACWNGIHPVTWIAMDHRDRTDLLASYRSMAVAPAVAAATWIGLSLTNPAALAVAGPILLLWGASPAIAWWLSRPLARRSARLTVDQAHFLRNLARKTWAYFETYVGPDDHFLPPDNVQEHPAVTIAHRTSPTNMGLALLANLTAHDFGYLSTGQLIVRTTNALRAGIAGRYRGHFYNWYDTQTGSPLAPRYVSTVDSNLAGHLLTLRPASRPLRCPNPQPAMVRGSERHAGDSHRSHRQTIATHRCAVRKGACLGRRRPAGHSGRRVDPDRTPCRKRGRCSRAIHHQRPHGLRDRSEHLGSGARAPMRRLA